MPNQHPPQPDARARQIPKQAARALDQARRAPPAHAKGVVQRDGDGDVEQDVRVPNAVVAPAGGPGDAGAGQELVAGGQGAVRALGGSVRVDEGAGGGAEEGGEVGAAGEGFGGVEAGEFVGGAGDGPVVHSCAGDAADEVG